MVKSKLDHREEKMSTPVESPQKWVRLDRPFPLPGYVKEALQKLDESGHIAYLVGGSVRDFLLGKELKDHDIATSAPPDLLCKLFPMAIEVGKEFGVIKVPTGGSPPLLEIATFRKDLEYSDHRRPEGVVFSGPLEDASRRDFTVNALYYDPKTNRILDSVGGMDDLKNKVIRAIGQPSVRFREDALRLLRAVRLKVRLEFQLDPETAQAIQARAKLISKVSAERIRDELTLMWTGPRAAQALALLSELALLDVILPEVEALKGVVQISAAHPYDDVWEHLLKMLEFFERQNPIRTATASWAAVLHEVGKPVVSKLSQGKNFNGHEIEGAKMAERIAERFKMSRNEVQRVSALVADHLKLKDVFQMRESTLQRLLREDHFEELLALHRADACAFDGNLAYYEFCASRLNQLKMNPHLLPPKLLDGRDLIQMGFSPGPLFSEILNVVEDLTLEKTLKTKDEALEYVLKTYVK
jgi:poly(A) polymerase